MGVHHPGPGWVHGGCDFSDSQPELDHLHHWCGVDLRLFAVGRHTRQDGPRGERILALKDEHRAPILSGFAGAGALALLHYRDPNVQGSYGFCPINYVTGLYCPGCGGLRATAELTHGSIASAIDLNVFAVVLVVLAIVWWAVWAVARFRGVNWRYFDLPKWFVWTLASTGAVFMVLRNLEFAAVLAP